MKSLGTITVSPQLPAPLAALDRLSANLRWSWRPQTRSLFSAIDPTLWQAVDGDPRAMLRRVPVSRLNELAADPAYVQAVAAESADLDRYLGQPLWFQRESADSRDGWGPLAAYFSMEFGITPSLPIYSGGLGVLAGDHLKSASDLGVPLIGVGLLYTYGYFAQSLTGDGRQEETYTAHSPRDLAVAPVCDDTGRQVTVPLSFPGEAEAQVALWVAQVGRIPLLLLDTNIDGNSPQVRELTDRLYGGNDEHRIRQELVLGVAGVRAVNAYCDTVGSPRPLVAHLNEGHAGFLGLERIAERIGARDLSFEEALAEVRAANVFTTHTPVPAGIDRFDVEMVRRYLDPDDEGTSRLFPGVPVADALALGAEEDPHRFNMAHMGLRVAARANGVAALHGEVSREMFADLYPGFDSAEVPIGHVTNGVHVPTWMRSQMAEYIQRATGGVDFATADSWPSRDSHPASLWQIRNTLRAELVERIRRALWDSWRHRGAHAAELGWIHQVLRPDVLTVGFARRVSTYKRLTLMLRNPERLRSILLNPERPVQFVIAGKAHPRDDAGKRLMRELVQFADAADVRNHFVFLPDYDLELARYLVSGSDVWLNNPVRPQEASGTSGMKAVMNGCLTLSVSDGWWDEMPQELGWTIPTVATTDQQHRDLLEAGALYDLLEGQIAPVFYDRGADGLPLEWLRRVEASMLALSPRVTSTRMVREYTTELYRPAAIAAQSMSGSAKDFVTWQRRVREQWPQVSVTDVRVDEHEPGSQWAALAGRPATVRARVRLGGLQERDVRVEALLGPVDAQGELVQPQREELHPVGDGVFSGAVVVDQPGETGVTVRVVPRHELLAAPAEMGLVVYAS